jgi:hypothetical protein
VKGKNCLDSNLGGIIYFTPELDANLASSHVGFEGTS